MKRILQILFALALFSTIAMNTKAQGTAFTYQGSLQNNGLPANGIYDVAFTLFGSSSGGSAIAGPITNTPTAVSNGLFTVTLDFGSAPFGGSPRWLEIAVRTNGNGGFSTLTPRQQLTPTPYAIFATSASNLTGTVSSSQVAGTYGNPVTFNNGANTFDGSFYGQFFGSSFIGGSFVGNFIGSGSGLGDVWHTGGNIGTTPANFLGTIDNQSLIFKVNGQRAAQIDPTTIDSPNITGGSPINSVDNGLAGATIVGGGTTNFLGVYSPNRISASFSTIAGGSANWIQAGSDHTIIGSGWKNQVSASTFQSVLGGGEGNLLGSPWSVLAGGSYNTMLDSSGNSVMGGGYINLISQNAGYSVLGGGFANNIQQGSGYAFIGGGDHNTNAAPQAFIGGGDHNLVQSNSPGASILAGYANSVRTNSGWSSIAAGYGNAIDPYSLVSSIAGGFGNIVQGDSTYWSNNNVFGSSIAGGAQNKIAYKAAYATIGAGLDNTIDTNAQFSTISGGYVNTIQSNGVYSTIGGGYLNQITSNAFLSTISGGYNNHAGYGATVPGGRDNVASGNYSFAAGRLANATNDGSFVLADDTASPLYSTANNQLTARFTGGIALQTGGAGLTVDGQPIAPGSASWSTTGNAGTTPGVNFIGTSDGQNLLIKGGFVGIGRANSIGSEFFGVQAPVSGVNYGGMYINTLSGTAKPFYGYALAGANVGWSYVDGNDGNKWKLNLGGDKITVTPGGLTGIGTTAPDATLSVNGTADKPGGGSWTVFSDARLKKNVQPLEGALDRLMRLQGVTFEYKDPGAIHELPGTQIGMIAQEVEKVFPDWVDTAPNGMKRLSIHGFEALTVEALRDLRKEKDHRVAALESENAKMQNELTEQKTNAERLEARLSALEKTLARFVGTEQASVTIAPSKSDPK